MGEETTWEVGAELPAQTLAPISRAMLALYAGGSNDHNPLHLDLDFARQAGLPDVIGQGMLTMALLGRYVTSLAPQRDLRAFGVRFLAMSQVGDALHCSARVAGIEASADGRVARLELSAARASGEVLASGEAVFWIGS